MWGPAFESIAGNSPGTVTLRINNLTQYLETLQSK